jgi:hypothetical protein
MAAMIMFDYFYDITVFAACLVGWCRLKLVKTNVESTRFLRFKLKCDEPLSNFAFNFNLHRYSPAFQHDQLVAVQADARGATLHLFLLDFWVRRCRLTLSNPRCNLQAPGNKRLKLKYHGTAVKMCIQIQLAALHLGLAQNPSQRA